MDGVRNQRGYSTTRGQPLGSVSISLGSWFSLSLPLAVVSKVSVVAEVVAVAGVGQPVSVIPIAIGMSSIAKTVIIQPGVSLGVSLSISLSSWLGLSLLYGHGGLSIILSSGRGGGSDQAVGENSVGAGDSSALVVLAANRGGVDHGVVVGIGVAIDQGGVVTHSVDKTGLGLGLSSSIGGDS